MKRNLKVLVPAILLAIIVIIAWRYLRGYSIPVLQPHGYVASEQRNLIIFVTLLGLLVVIPVFVMTFLFAYRYRESNTKAKYQPDWGGSKLIEAICWGIPFIIIVVLAFVTWKSSHELDPYKALDSSKKPLTVQVVALEWKWLFIYPDQGIATVNYLRIPEKTPINFKLTSDAPMNSFWIPSLGGQVYAMSGMTTKLHLIADKAGSFRGSSSNLSGEGFAGMKFTVDATSQKSFDAWVKSAQNSPSILDQNEYALLAKKSTDVPPAYYRLTNTGLYDTIVMKYMMDMSSNEHSHHKMGEHTGDAMHSH